MKVIVEYRQAHGVSPTIGELAERVFVEPQTVMYHIEILERMGMIRRIRKGRLKPPRLVRITNEGYREYKRITNDR